MLSIADLAHRRDPEAIAAFICQEVQSLDIGEIKVEVEIADSNLDIQIRTNAAFDKDKLLTLLRHKLPTLRIKSVSKFRIHCWRTDAEIYEQRLLWTEQFMLDPQNSTISLGQNALAGFDDDIPNPSTTIAPPKELRSPEPQLSKHSVLQQAIAQIMPDSANVAANYLDPSQLNSPINRPVNSSEINRTNLSQPNSSVQSSSLIKQPISPKATSDRSYGQLLLVGGAIVLLGLGIGASVRTITANVNAAKGEEATSLGNANLSSSNPERVETKPEIKDNTKAVTTAQTSPESTEANVITLEKFNRVEKGMTLAQVEKILGTSGSVIAENVSNNSIGKVYSWKNPQGSNAIIEFKDGQVVAKAQAGL